MSSAATTMPFPVRLRTALQLDPVLLGIVLTLLLGGLVILTSASTSIADSTGGHPFYYLQRQLLAVAIGLAASGLCLFIPMAFWHRMGPLLLLAGLALLLVVLVPGIGYEVNGARRWVRLGFMNLQASEPARLCFILYLSGYLVRHAKDVQTRFVGFLRPMLVMTVAAVALLAEPDFGAATVLMCVAMIMLFVAGARIRDFLLFSTAGVASFVVLALTSPYRYARLKAFIDPWDDPFNTDFQLIQSLIAIGRGEWVGVGLGNSVQKLFYLPEAHTDFVFAVFAEEFGLLGSFLVVAVFAALVWRCFNLARRASDADRVFEAYVAIGIGTWLGVQAFINLGVNMGMLPTKGLTLPLVSYGRSSIIMAMVSIAVLLRIHHELSVDAKPVNRRRRTVKS
ncbi:MAG: putative lipid II flippase FtsW [Pseudomonadota bacterium]